MRGDDFPRKLIRAHARLRLGINAKKTPVACLADKWLINIDGMGGKAGLQIRINRGVLMKSGILPFLVTGLSSTSRPTP